MFDDTIVAISTPYGLSGIGIVRLSGSESLRIAGRIFLRKDKKSVYDLRDHSINYGWIFNHENNELIDEVMLSIFKSPRSYTREDMVEINCHGGLIPVTKIYRLILRLGARDAEKGEFTKRAFLNGRLDLTQAEAVFEIINSKSECELSLAVNKLKGGLSRRLLEIKEKILGIISEINAGTDFDDCYDFNSEDIGRRINNIKDEINRIIIDKANNDRKINGYSIAFCGKPNVGKSSIINKLCGEDRIIVSDIPGTTRDCINVDHFYEGNFYNFIDTAGIRNVRTKIEGLSIKRSFDTIEGSDCIIMIFDLSRRIDETDKRITKWITTLKKDIIWVANKTDKESKANNDLLLKLTENEEMIRVSAKKDINLNAILKKIYSVSRKILDSKSENYLLNMREEEKLRDALKLLEDKRGDLGYNLRSEILCLELNSFCDKIDEILGYKNSYDNAEEIFKRFCVGK